jgi:ABC-2 type transport system permease protein/lipopolysaccharide transport system permease protein
MIILAVVFSTIFKQDIRTYSIYIFSGMIPWLYINASITMGCQTLINAEGFLKKVYIPKLLFPTISVTTETVNFILSIVSLYLLGLFVGFPIRVTILYLPLVIIITLLFNLGWVLILSVTTIFFRDTTHLISIIFQALFYLAPIIYPLESIPEQFRSLFLFNPFYYFIILFRKVIYGEPGLTLVDWLAPIGLTALVLTIGLYILKRLDRTIVYRL